MVLGRVVGCFSVYGDVVAPQSHSFKFNLNTLTLLQLTLIYALLSLEFITEIIVIDALFLFSLWTYQVQM